MAFKTFGKLPTGADLQRIHQSPNYKNGSFRNHSETPMMAKDAPMLKLMRQLIRKPKNTAPSKPLPTVHTDLKNLPTEKTVLVWFGHSSYYLQCNGKRILVDPVFSGYASPFPVMGKSFKGTNVYSVDDMPPIDYLILSHDHYDHMDFTTLKKLKAQVEHVFCPLGVGPHLKYWGYDATAITELDWWQTVEIEAGTSLTAAPARHFSGRGLKRGQSLWASFILKIDNHNFYIGGDSGYDTHFKAIGERFGPFDLAILECGQYSAYWPHIHMMPEETVQAAVDLGAKLLLPVHWAKFTLALHPWDEPIKRITAKAATLNMPITTPMIGEPVVISEDHPQKKWWESI